MAATQRRYSKDEFARRGDTFNEEVVRSGLTDEDQVGRREGRGSFPETPFPCLFLAEPAAAGAVGQRRAEVAGGSG